MAREKKVHIDLNGNEYASMSRLCGVYGINYNKMYDMVNRRGYSEADAIKKLLTLQGRESEIPNGD